MKDCNQCGKCCIKYGADDLSATTEEVDLWGIFNPEIFRFVKNNQIWFDHESALSLKSCPFLEIEPQIKPLAENKYTRSIHLDKPEDCRHYPSLIAEMIRDQCEMVEVIDLENTEESTNKAR